jgi:hypothetical protein
MLTVTATTSTWPTEVLKITYPNFVAPRNYQVYPNFADTITSNGDRVNSWVNIDVAVQPHILHNNVQIIERNVPVSAASAITYNSTAALSSSLFVPANDNASMTVRYFSPSNTTSLISPEFATVVNTALPLSTREYALEQTTINAGSGQYIIPTHLSFADTRTPLEIRDSNHLQFYPTLRQYQTRYYGSYGQDQGILNASPYNIPFIGYVDNVKLPWVSTNLSIGQVSALRVMYKEPVVYRHVAGLPLADIEEGTAIYADNLLDQLEPGFETSTIKPGSLLLQFGYYDPAITSSKITQSTIVDNKKNSAKNLTTVAVPSSYTFERNAYRFGYVRDVPSLTAVSPTTAPLVGRAGVTNEMIVNSSTSYINYTTGELYIQLAGGYTFSANALRSSYYNRSFVEYGGYPQYEILDTNNINQRNSIFSQVSSVGAVMNASFDVTVANLSSVVDLNDYPSIGSRPAVTTSLSAVSGISLSYNTSYNFAQASAVRYNFASTVPPWLFTYTSVMSSSAAPTQIINGMDLAFNILSAQTIVSLNSAIVEPYIVSNYGTTFYQFSAKDAPFGYFQLEVPGAITENNGVASTAPLSVYLLNPDNTLSNSYPMSMNSLGIEMPYKVKSFTSTPTIPLSSLQQNIKNDTTPLTLRNIAHYYGDNIEQSLKTNLNSIQLYAIKNAILTSSYDNSLSLVGSVQTFINKMYKYVNECINPSNKTIGDLQNIGDEIQYKFNSCGNIYKAFYEAFSSICRNYVNTAAQNNAQNSITPLTIELCNSISATLGELAAQNASAVSFDIASNLFSIKSLIETTDTVSYNFIVDVLTESFIIATWPESYNVTSVLNQTEITYDLNQFSVIKKILSLRLERAFGFYNSALDTARRAGKITTAQYEQFLQYFAAGDFATFNVSVIALKDIIDYNSLIAAKINKEYAANSNKHIASYIFAAEAEINKLFTYLYAISVFDRDTIFADLYTSLNLEDYGVKHVVARFINRNALIDKSTNAEVFASGNLQEINNLNHSYYTSPLVPLSSRFCIVSPISGFHTASYKLNIFTNKIGANYVDLDNPTAGKRSYVHKNVKLNKKIRPYSKSDFILNKAEVGGGIGLTFSKPFSGNDVLRIDAIIPPGLIPVAKRTEATITWRVVAIDTDANYLKAWLPTQIYRGNTLIVDSPFATAFTSAANFLHTTAALAQSSTQTFVTSTSLNNTFGLFGQTMISNNAATLGYLGVNPITVSVSVSSNYLSAYTSPYITNNTITARAVYVPDLGQIDTFNRFTAVQASAYSPNAITSNLSVVSADFTSIDNPILLRNYFIKNNRIYNPPVNERSMFNIESVYGAHRLFSLSATNASEQEIPSNSYVTNSPYFKVKTIMPKTLSLFSPPKDKMYVNIYNTPASILPPARQEFSLSFFPHPSNISSKFGISSTTVSGASSINASIGSNTNTDLIIALTANTTPYSLSFTPISSVYSTYQWIVSAIPTSAYSIDDTTKMLTISSSRLSSVTNNVAFVQLSTLFSYQDSVTKAALVSDPIYMYVSDQVINSLSARAWTVNRFNQNGLSAVNNLSAVTVNTRLTSIGDGHVETLTLRTLGTLFDTYAWQIGNSYPLVTNTNALTATIAGNAGDSLNISVTGYNLKYTDSSHLRALSAEYDSDKVLIVNPSFSANRLAENDFYSVTTQTSAITSTFFKPLEFRTLNTPVVSSVFNNSVYFFNDNVNIQYGVVSYVGNTVGERLSATKFIVSGNIENPDTMEVKLIPQSTFTTVSGLSSNVVTLATIGNLNLFDCSILTLTSNNTGYVTVSNEPRVLKESNSTEVFELTAIKIPEFNLFWDDTHYQVGDALVIKNNSIPRTCFNLNIGYETLSVKFNNQTQIVPASTTEIIFNNLDDNGIYSIEISGRTLSALSASYPIVATEFVNAITVVDKFDTFNKDARILNEKLVLPYSVDEIYVAPNEFAVADNINAALTKLYENYKYLKNKAQFNDTKLPVSFNKWLGSIADGVNKWRYVENSKWYNTANTVLAKEFKQILALKVVKDKLIVADRLTTNTDRIAVYDFDLLSQRESIKLNVIGEDTFGQIASIDTDSNGDLYVLDKAANAIYQYAVNYTFGSTLVLVKKIGGLGNASRPYRFNAPHSLHISDTDRIYVVDQKNDVIKVYNNKLGYLFNISYKDWVMQNDILSVSTDAEENVYVLRKNGSVYVFDSAGKYIRTISGITNPFNGTPVKILCNRIDDGISYVLYETHVAKITNSGQYLGYFQPLYHPYVNKLADIVQYSRNIIIADQFAIYNNVDFISLKSIVNDIDSVEWKLEDILIGDNELIQDWVYNVSFNRIKDNFELYVKNIHSKYVFSVNIDGNVLTNIVPMPTSELPTLDFSQSVIGQNELVFADVINRVLKQLYQNQEAILESIESTIKTNLCADNWCWSWASMGSVDPIKKNCLVNPITFMELQNNSPGIGGRTWLQMTNTDTCCEIISS